MMKGEGRGVSTFASRAAGGERDARGAHLIQVFRGRGGAFFEHRHVRLALLVLVLAEEAFVRIHKDAVAQRAEQGVHWKQEAPRNVSEERSSEGKRKRGFITHGTTGPEE